MRSVAAGCLVAVFCSMLASGLAAQEKRTPDELEAISQLAMKRASEGQFQQAIELWTDILDEVPPTTALDLHVNIGVAYNRLQDLPAAWHHLSIYLESADKADKAVAKERQKIGKKLGKTHTLVSFKCEPAALLRLSPAAALVYPCPLDWYLARGSHTLVVEKAGHESEKRTVEVGKAAVTETFALKKAVVLGTLVVLGDGKAVQVFLDGRLEGVVPFERKLKPGTYELMVAKPGEMPWKKTITLASGGLVRESPEVARRLVAKVPVKGPEGGTTGSLKLGNEIVEQGPAASRSKALEWSLIGTGGALLLGGGIFHVLAITKDLSLRDEIAPGEAATMDDFNSRTARYNDGWEEDVKPRALTAYALYGVGAATAVAGAVLLIVDTGNREKAEALSHKFYPLVTPHGSGMGFALSF
jgi:hypothetical protein